MPRALQRLEDPSSNADHTAIADLPVLQWQSHVLALALQQALETRVMACSAVILALLRVWERRVALPPALRPTLLKSEDVDALDMLLESLLITHVQVGVCGCVRVVAVVRLYGKPSPHPQLQCIASLGLHVACVVLVCVEGGGAWLLWMCRTTFSHCTHM